MRRLDILNITPSTITNPAEIEVGLDFTSIFHGKEWIDGAGTRYPFWTYTSNTVPVGTTLLVATSFDIVENSKYNGTYTVYTKLNSGDFESSEFNGVSTILRVSQPMVAGSGNELTDGFITNISTYLLTVIGEGDFVLLEKQIEDTRPIELVGRFTSGWGEVLMQNLLRQVQSFAGSSAPTNPFQGQLWFDLNTGILMVKPTSLNNGDWQPVGSSGSSATEYRHTQSVAATTWTVPHNLGLTAPYFAGCDFFVNVGPDVKPILPIDVTYVNGNQLAVTFSNPETGYVIVRA